MISKNANTICVYCGKEKATTVDHVPPKCFFPKPRPHNLITVPACRRCNKEAEKDEEFFLATFMFSEASQSRVGKALWAEKMNRVYFRGRGVGSAIRKRMNRVNLTTASGIYYGKGFALEIDYARLETVVTKIVRGLYYREYSEPLTKEVPIKCQWLNTPSFSKRAESYVKNLPFAETHWPGIFEYKFGRTETAPEKSLWLMRFFSFASFWAVTGNYGALTKK